jgi:hypothetical protein
MNPATIELIATALVKYGPAVARALVEIFRKPTVTPDDWEKIFKLADRSYDDYVAPRS